MSFRRVPLLGVLVLTGLCSVASPKALRAQGFIDPIQASSSGGFQSPDLRIGTNDVASVLFEDGINLFLANAQLGFGQEVPVTNSPAASSQGSLAAGSSFLFYAAYQEETSVPGETGTEIMLRSNNGGSFGPPQLVTSNNGIDDRNPSVLVTTLGNVDVVWERQDGALDAEIWIARDAGSPVMIGMGAEPVVADLGGGTVYVGYQRGGSLFGRTFDGTTVGSEETIDTPAGVNQRLDLGVDAAGAVHCAFQNATGDAVYYVRREAAGGFTTAEERDPGPAGPPSIAAGQAGHAALSFSKGGQIRVQELNLNSVWTPTNLTPFLSVAVDPSVAMDSLDYIHVVYMAFGSAFYTNNVPAPVVDFSSSTTSGQLALTVDFEAEITGVFTAANWDFGDGNTGFGATVSHTYVDPGTFTVSLTVMGPGGTTTETKTDFISTTVPPDSVKLPRIQVLAGQTDVIHPIFATHTEDIQGFQLAIAYDATVVPVSEFTLSSSLTESLNPEFIDIEFGGSGANSSVVVGIILDTESPFDFRNIPAGTNQLLAGLRYDVPAGLPAGTQSDLTFVDGIGSPPLNNIFSPSLGASIVPYKLNGRVTVIDDLTLLQFLRGDVNLTSSIDIADAVSLLTFLFTQGDPPACFDAADANDDGQVNIGDAIYLLSYLFTNGASPPYPFPTAGFDPTEDTLDPCLQP